MPAEIQHFRPFCLSAVSIASTLNRSRPVRVDVWLVTVFQWFHIDDSGHAPTCLRQFDSENSIVPWKESLWLRPKF